MQDLQELREYHNFYMNLALLTTLILILLLSIPHILASFLGAIIWIGLGVTSLFFYYKAWGYLDLYRRQMEKELEKLKKE